MLNTRSHRRFSYRLKSYTSNHLQAAVSGWHRLWQKPLMTLATLGMMALGLTFPLLLALLMDNLQALKSYWQDDRQIALFLQLDATPRVEALQQSLLARDDVAAVNYVSPDQGMELLSKSLGETAIASQLPHNPLPPLVEVTPKIDVTSPEAMQNLIDELGALPEVASVKVDMLWIKRLHHWMHIIAWALYCLMSLLIIAVLLISFYTIYHAIRERREEIYVISLVGGTQGFIRRPFLYMGLFYGLFSALCACFLVYLVQYAMYAKIMHLASLYAFHISIIDIDVVAVGIILLLSAFMGWLGAWFATEIELMRAIQDIT